MNNYDYKKELSNLSKGIATSLTGGPGGKPTGPGGLVGALFGALTDVFYPDPSLPNPLDAFKKEVDFKLSTLSEQVQNLQTSVDAVVQLSSKIEMGVQDALLDDLMSSMVKQSAIIDQAFTNYVTYVQALADNSTSPSEKDNAYSAMFTLLTTDPLNGPSAIHNALLEYQTHLLGNGGSKGVLDFLFQMIQHGWQSCAAQVGATPDYSSQDKYQTLYPGWADSIGYIWNTCVKQSFTNLQDENGRQVRTVVASILSVQLKGYTLLRSAYSNVSIEAQTLVDVENNLNVIGLKLANLWSSFTDAAAINTLGMQLLIKNGIKLGAGRADSSFWAPWNFEGNVPRSRLGDADFASRDLNGPVQVDNIIGMCNVADGHLANVDLIYRYSGDRSTGMFPCMLRQGIELGSKSQVAMPVMLTAPWRPFYTSQKVTDVLAPFCWCGTSVCTKDQGLAKCHDQWGQSSWLTDAFARSDKNGNSCWDASVPQCYIPDAQHRVEYFYDSIRLTMNTPFGNLPPIPDFLQYFQETFSN